VVEQSREYYSRKLYLLQIHILESRIVRPEPLQAANLLCAVKCWFLNESDETGGRGNLKNLYLKQDINYFFYDAFRNYDVYGQYNQYFLGNNDNYYDHFILIVENIYLGRIVAPNKY